MWHLTEAEDIKKRWQEYTEKLYKKDLHDQHNHDGVITHLEPDILECEVKWALGKLQYQLRAGSFEKTLMLGKIRDLFKKIRDTKGTFHAKMGSIKDRNGMEDRKSTRLNSSHSGQSRMPSSA